MHRRPIEEVDATFFPTLSDMLPRCDVLVITCALTPETRHMFGEEQFQLMKRSAVLINVARGEVFLLLLQIPTTLNIKCEPLCILVRTLRLP